MHQRDKPLLPAHLIGRKTEMLLGLPKTCLYGVPSAVGRHDGLGALLCVRTEQKNERTAWHSHGHQTHLDPESALQDNARLEFYFRLLAVEPQSRRPPTRRRLGPLFGLVLGAVLSRLTGRILPVGKPPAGGR